MPILTAAPWQRGRIERHGSIVKEIISRMNQEMPILNERDFDTALLHAFQAKNSLSSKSGYSPEQAVLGKSARLPGSLCEDENLQNHFQNASESEHLSGFHNTNEVRIQARLAFLKADNSQAIRRSMLRLSRGLVHSWKTGQMCMFWDRRKAANMLEKGRWCGPARVILQESRTIVWISYLNRLLRCAYENLRPITMREHEAYRFQTIPEDQARLEQMAKQLQIRNRERSGMFQFSDLVDVEPPEDVEEDRGELEAPFNVQPEEEPKRHVSNASEENHPDTASQFASPIRQEETNPPDVPNTVSSDVPAREADEMGREPDVPIESDEQEPLNMVGHSCYYVEGNQEFVVRGDQEAYWAEKDEQSHDMCSFEFEMPMQQFRKFQSDHRMHDAYIVKAARKTQTEVKFATLTNAEKEQFKKAKGKEIGCWIDTNAVKRILRNKVHPDRIMSSRWILTWKKDEAHPEGRKAKARLVVRGYQDPEIDQVSTESPTLTRDARMLLLQVIATKQWRLQNFDVTTAFLRGRADERILAMDPPEELRHALSMGKDEVCLLQGNAYGRVDAPLLFYKEMRKQLERLSFEAHPMDECLFLLRNAEDRTQLDGILGIHVDDGLGGGNERYEEALRRLQETLPFGSHEYDSFRFTGLDLEQLPDYSIKISQENYLHKIDPIDVPKERRKHGNSPASDNEVSQLRALCGSMQYAAVNSRPDLSAKVSMMQKSIPNATVNSLMEGNKVLKEAKETASTSVHVRPLKWDDLMFASFGDASFASEKNLKAQQGLFIVACHPSLAQNETSEITPVSWNSKQIGRVVRSTLSAEAYAMSSSLDKLTWIRCMWEVIKNPEFRWSKPEDSLKETNRGLLITDCKSLYDLINKLAIPNCQEWRTTIEVRLIKEQIKDNAECRWISTAIMLADALTKSMDASFLRKVLALGRFRIYDVDMTLRENANKKYAHRWIQNSQ